MSIIDEVVSVRRVADALEEFDSLLSFKFFKLAVLSYEVSFID